MSDALKEYISDWARIIWDACGDQTKVDRAILLADLNGMFDPAKVATLSAQSLETPPALVAQREALEKALKPFAIHADCYEGHRDEDDISGTLARNRLKVRDLRACRAILAALTATRPREGRRSDESLSA